MQGTSPEAPAPPGASDIGSVPTASTLAPGHCCPSNCPSNYPSHSNCLWCCASPCCCTCFCLHSSWGGRRKSNNVFWANQENDEEESYGDDGGIGEVASEVVQVEIFLSSLAGQHNLPCCMFLMSFMTLMILKWLNCCFSPNNINSANDWGAGMISQLGEFYVCSACTMVMVHNQSTRDSHKDFSHKSVI